MKGKSISMNMGMKHLSKSTVLFIFQEFVILFPHHDPWLCFQNATYPSSFCEINVSISSVCLLLQTNSFLVYLSALTKFLISNLSKKNTPLLVFLKDSNKEISSMYSICEKSCYAIWPKGFTQRIYMFAMKWLITFIYFAVKSRIRNLNC